MRSEGVRYETVAQLSVVVLEYLGEVYQFVRERVFHELDYYQNEGGELAILNGNKGRMFLQKNCSLIQ
jgi:hypothetical protein